MSPNAPLYTPSAPNTVKMSIDYTIQGYLAAGVPAKKIMVGIPFYGHTWFDAGMSGTAWQKFGGNGTVQGRCCGPFKSTYGGKPGQACAQCGVMMYTEIQAAGCPTFFDDETKSDIMYCSSAGSDSGYTEAGTWITYNSKKSIHEITQYMMDQGLGGVFVFDTSMDTVSNGQFTFEPMNQIAADLDGASPSPPSPAPPGPSPSSSFKCVNNACVPGAGGLPKSTCEAVCGPTTYKCIDNKCVPKAGGIGLDECNAVCGSQLV